MDAKLVVVGGEARVTEVQLKLPTIIGRGRAAGITLPHPLVSRQHCEIYEEQGRLVVNDMGSLNGTFVGDQRINEPTFLLPGELLTVGTVTFRAAYALANGKAKGHDDESTGMDVAASDATVQFADRTIADGNRTVQVDEDLAEALPVEDDVVGVEVDDVDFAEAEVEEVAEVAEVEVEVEGEATADTSELNTGETSGDEDDDDLQSFLKGLG
jgi:pSer/pThr/pTyr-binding forkhead associated (FHA) protein